MKTSELDPNSETAIKAMTNKSEDKMFISGVKDFSKFAMVNGEATETSGRLTLRVPADAVTRGRSDEFKTAIETFAAELDKAEGEIGSIYNMAEATLEGQLEDLNDPDNDEDELKTIINQIKGSYKDFTERERNSKVP